MHDPENSRRHHERPRKAGCGIHQLVRKLDIMMINPSSRNHRPITRGYTRLGKQPSQEVPHNSTNRMGCKDIQRIIIAKDELEWVPKVAKPPRHETKKNGGGRSDVTRCRRDCNQTCDRTRTKPNSRPFLLKTIIPEHPRQPTNGRCQLEKPSSQIQIPQSVLEKK